MTNCYCGSQKDYQECCHPFLVGKQKPQDPEQLMRSRYSAFCTKEIVYLISTHHPSRQQPDEKDVLEKTIHQTEWLGLKIIKTKTVLNQDIGYVEFAAFYKKNTEIGQLHENSKFIQEQGQWFYFDGVLMEPLKFSRNEPCWCKSNKKYKRCHGK